MIKERLREWVKKVVLSFVLCAVVIFGLATIIQKYNITDKYMVIALLLCAGYYLYQILSIVKIRCPQCGKPLIFSLYAGTLSLDVKNYTFKKCNNCGKIFD